MTALGRALAPPRPWHLILAPIVPLLALLRSSVGISPPDVVVMPLAVSMAVAVALWLVVLPLSADRHRAAFAVTLVMLAGMSYMSMVRFFHPLGMGRVVAFLYVLVFVCAVALVRSGRPAGASTTFANKVLLLTVVFLSLPIVWGEWRRIPARAEPLALGTEPRRDRPDVYVIVLDGYGREDVLRDVYGFDNPLVRDLRAAGFAVPALAAANYAQTALSLASALNAEYMPALGHPENPDADSRRGLADLIGASRFFDAFARSGYHIRTYASEYAMIRSQEAHETPSPFPLLDEFGYATFEATVLPAFFQSTGLPRGWLPLHFHRRHLAWTLEDLASDRPGEKDRPLLVFAHLLAPHPPFALDSEGGIRHTRVPALFNDGEHWRAIAQGTGERYEAGYLDMLKFVNRGILRVVQNVVRRGRPAIVLIHGDHGPGAGLVWGDPAKTDMRERMGILLALSFPEGEAEPVEARTTLVNAYRAVLNRALGLTLPRVDDRSYFSTWSQPFVYLDVTDKLECHDCQQHPDR